MNTATANVVQFKPKAEIKVAASNKNESDYFVRYAAMHRSIIADLIVTVSAQCNVGHEYMARVIEAKFNAKSISDLSPKQLFDAIAFLLEMRDYGSNLHQRVAVAGRA